MRALFLALALTAAMRAESVFFSANGKAFHKSGQCMSLSRAKHVLTSERADAEQHGLHECSICYRAANPKHAKGANSAWAKEVSK